MKRNHHPAARRAALPALVLAAAASAACSGNRHPVSVPATAPAVPAERGMASWYGSEFAGRRTASGERFDKNGFTAAHRSLPFGTLVQVTNLSSGRQVVVLINDRGPFTHRRVIDVSYAAARKLGLIGPGTARVELAVLKLPGGGGGRDEAPPPVLMAAGSDGPSPAEAPGTTADPATQLTPQALSVVLPASSSPARPDVAGDPSGTAGEAAPAGPVARPSPATRLAAGAALSQQRAAAGMRYTVQVGAFADPARAEALQRELRALYPEAAIRSDGTWSRVQVGVFQDREQAEELGRELGDKDLPALVVTLR